MNTFFAIFGALFYLLLITLPFVITFYKRKKQVGKTWSYPVTATLKISGKELSCNHCGHVKFQKREGIFVTSWVAFFHFSFWNHSGVCYTCMNCGHVEWFTKPQEENVEFSRSLTE